MTDPWESTKGVLGGLRDQVAGLRASGAIEPPRTPETAVGVGEALEGKVRVEATPAQVTSLRVDPSALRTRLPDLVVAIVEATNTALEQARTAMVESVPAAPPLDHLAATLDNLAADSLRASQEAADGVRRSMAAIQRISELHRRNT